MSKKVTYHDFKPGDRVRYVGTITPTLVGQTGTVDDPPNSAIGEVYVLWDNGLKYGVYASNIILDETDAGMQPDARQQELHAALDRHVKAQQAYAATKRAFEEAEAEAVAAQREYGNLLREVLGAEAQL